MTIGHVQHFTEITLDGVDYCYDDMPAVFSVDLNNYRPTLTALQIGIKGVCRETAVEFFGEGDIARHEESLWEDLCENPEKHGFQMLAAE